ncbi:MAG TPA: hypothetical protein VEV41_06005 [Terriglobales bacterium]|nr:hypothetical protein [Terriglobales bacterium]
MASGIRSATPLPPRVSAEDAIRAAGRVRASLAVTQEDPTERGTLLARQETLRQGAHRVSQVRPGQVELHDRSQCGQGLALSARAPAVPFSAIRFSLDRVSAAPRLDLSSGTGDSDRRHPY